MKWYSGNENKKSGTLSQKEMDSALVGPAGLEPATP